MHDLFFASLCMWVFLVVLYTASSSFNEVNRKKNMVAVIVVGIQSAYPAFNMHKFWSEQNALVVVTCTGTNLFHIQQNFVHTHALCSRLLLLLCVHAEKWHAEKFKIPNTLFVSGTTLTTRTTTKKNKKITTTEEKRGECCMCDA